METIFFLNWKDVIKLFIIGFIFIIILVWLLIKYIKEKIKVNKKNYKPRWSN